MAAGLGTVGWAGVAYEVYKTVWCISVVIRNSGKLVQELAGSRSDSGQSANVVIPDEQTELPAAFVVGSVPDHQ